MVICISVMCFVQSFQESADDDDGDDRGSLSDFINDGTITPHSWTSSTGTGDSRPESVSDLKRHHFKKNGTDLKRRRLISSSESGCANSPVEKKARKICFPFVKFSIK